MRTNEVYEPVAKPFLKSLGHARFTEARRGIVEIPSCARGCYHSGQIFAVAASASENVLLNTNSRYKD